MGSHAGLAAVRDRLTGALGAASDRLEGDEPRVLADLLAHLCEQPRRPSPEAQAPARSLARSLAAFADADARRRAALADLMGLAARGLATAGDPPRDPSGAAAFEAALRTTERIYGGGHALLGRPPFVPLARLKALLTEARAANRTPVSDGHEIGEPGSALRALAVDDRLRAAMSEAASLSVAPTYRAVYMYLSPGAQVPPHVDHADYELIFHLTLEHSPPADGSRRSALYVYRLEGAPVRLELAAGEGLVLRGRGSIHAREPITDGERWTSIAIGFAPQRVPETASQIARR